MPKILVALDGSKLAENGLEAALVIARKSHDSRLILMTVLDSATSEEGLTSGSIGFQHGHSQTGNQKEETARKYLDRLIAQHNTEGFPLQIEIGRGRAAGEILRYAGENQIDFIVITTRGRSGLKKFLLGSVAAEIIAASPVPVLVLPPERKFHA